MTSALADAEQFLEQNPDIRWIDAVLPDINGVPRGKRLSASSLKKLATTGILLPESLIVSSYEGETVEETGYGLATGDEDAVCRPIAGTLAQSKWAPVPTAHTLMSMTTHDGATIEMDPRSTLARVIRRLEKDGLRATVAIELECYLIDAETDALGRPKPPIPPIGGRRLASSQLYGLDDLEAFSTVLEAVSAACRPCGIEITTAISEYGPGQIEINLPHRSDALRACDEAILFKRAVRGVARQAGIDATFMAKPYADKAGSGMHVHVSLQDADGRYVFGDADTDCPKPLGHAIAGTLDLMKSSLALFVPNLNGFRRLRPGSFAPIEPNWGIDNRTVAVRIPNSDPQNRRLEHRVSSADANPYLVTAAILSAMHHGIVHQLDPGEPTRGDGYERQSASDWDSWAKSIDWLDQSKPLRQAFGDKQVDAFTIVKRHERTLHQKEIAPIDFRWHL